MTAPQCPISYGQLPKSYGPRATLGTNIPIATDLESLIITVNRIRDVLRSLTTSLTVNNTYLPRQPNFKKEGNKYYSQYPQWDQANIETTTGFVFHKTKEGPDPESRAYVIRQNKVHFQNRSQEDPEFVWSYVKPIK